MHCCGIDMLINDGKNKVYLMVDGCVTGFSAVNHFSWGKILLVASLILVFPL